jgi:hypothetical protein
VRSLGPFVQLAACFLSRCFADDLHRGTIGAQLAGHYDLWIAVSLH